MRRSTSDTSTSWQPVSDWYNQAVGKEGNYYHQHLVLPNSLRLLQLSKQTDAAILDLACGQGVLARTLPKEVLYYGVDLARDLIGFAQKHQPIMPRQHFIVGNVSKPLSISQPSFTHAACILALQNIRHVSGVLENAASYLQTGGRFLIVLNHPCFRIPRQSSWGVDEAKKTQYRRIDKYMSEMEIPITAHPGLRNSAVTWSFHRPLASYAALLAQSGFVIKTIEEWVSDKKSEGKAAKMEDRSRQEFPLFMAILAEKKAGND